MKPILLALFGCCFAVAFGQRPVFVATDIDHFWAAYDKIAATSDTLQKQRYLKEYYFDKASPGLKSLMEVRRYTAKEYLDAIHGYPKFWRSLRPRTKNISKLYPEIEADIQKFQRIYHNTKPATIYFSIGVFRTNGTTQDDRVLIGSECALADQTVIIDELPQWRQPFFTESNQRDHIALLCTHEYIHTQQNPLVENLLSMCLYEGVAEFLSCVATGKKSNVPAIAFGKAHEKEVVAQFVSDLYVMSHNYNWIWGENRNQFKVRDLGYYIGYEICERYYNAAPDKQTAAKELVSLDYDDEKAVEHLVDQANLLPKKVAELYAEYEQKRPVVQSVEPFANGASVKPGKTLIRITFSEPLNGQNTGVDLGPLGENAFPKLSPQRKWSDDGKSWTIEADLEPNRHYQILISNNFRKSDQTRLKPYLIDFSTTD